MKICKDDLIIGVRMISFLLIIFCALYQTVQDRKLVNVSGTIIDKYPVLVNGSTNLIVVVKSTSRAYSTNVSPVTYSLSKVNSNITIGIPNGTVNGCTLDWSSYLLIAAMIVFLISLFAFESRADIYYY